MEKDYLELDLTYYMSGEFKIKGDLNDEGRKTVIEEFLRAQMGKGADERPAIEREVYRISLRWFPCNDLIRSRDDTGNKGLRDGILYEVLRKLQ